ncbi:MAG: hypothetical protein IAC61_00490 [Firmicutes bacterium]|uniref:Cohesin domain-containing protein n=1 Tax=Candidatus Alloenteromonas pullistercoris TaxID=2840785 RepID=A0A9D9GV50_9FIRM|nr:hypothetical protein [Candidatus Enteromonas pullistercoris]
MKRKCLFPLSAFALFLLGCSGLDSSSQTSVSTRPAPNEAELSWDYGVLPSYCLVNLDAPRLRYGINYEQGSPASFAVGTSCRMELEFDYAPASGASLEFDPSLIDIYSAEFPIFPISPGDPLDEFSGSFQVYFKKEGSGIIKAMEGRDVLTELSFSASEPSELGEVDVYWIDNFPGSQESGPCRVILISNELNYLPTLMVPFVEDDPNYFHDHMLLLIKFNHLQSPAYPFLLNGTLYVNLISSFHGQDVTFDIGGRCIAIGVSEEHLELIQNICILETPLFLGWQDAAIPGP